LKAQAYLPYPYNGSKFYNYVQQSGVADSTSAYTWLHNHNNGDTVIGKSTKDYNCHQFAWPNDHPLNIVIKAEGLSEYGDYNCYDQDPNGYYKAPYIYWGGSNTSQMYDTTDEKHAEIAVFGGGNVFYGGNISHSAVRITNSNSTNTYVSNHYNQYSKYAGWYISKWGEGPLVIHQLRDCPDCGNNVVFFKKHNDNQNANNIKYTINGKSRVCAYGATYTIPSWGISSATWSIINGPLSIVSQNGTSCIIQATGHGNDRVKVSFTSVYGSDTTSMSVSGDFGPDNIGSISTSPYDPSGSSPIIVSQNTWVHFYCHPFTGNDFYDLTSPFNTYDSHWATDYSWTCNPSSYGQNPEPQHSRSVLIMFNQPYYYTLTAIVSNACGSKQYQQSIYVTPGWYFSLSPNPASTNNVTVTMLKGNNPGTDQTVIGNDLTESTIQIVTNTTPEVQTNVPVTYTVKIVNSFGSLFYSSKKTGDSFTIPVGNLGKGNYLVQISDGKTVSSQTLIISR
jgi:hypothetical protein